MRANKEEVHVQVSGFTEDWVVSFGATSGDIGPHEHQTGINKRAMTGNVIAMFSTIRRIVMPSGAPVEQQDEKQRAE